MRFRIIRLSGKRETIAEGRGIREPNFTGMRRMALAARKSGASGMSTRLIKSRPQSGASFVLCVDNSEYPASLELHKIYRMIADRGALERGDLRVVDESGEDYQYPADWFIPIDLPHDIRVKLTRGPRRSSKR